MISTDPEGGATTFRGETVELVVSKGPPLVTVPNVVGRNEAEARAALEDAGFVVNVNKPLGLRRVRRELTEPTGRAPRRPRARP